MAERDSIATLNRATEALDDARRELARLHARAVEAERIIRKTADIVQVVVFAIDAVDRVSSSGTSSVRRGEALASLRVAKRRCLTLGVDLVAYVRES